jgi:hypothetical protein
MDPLTAVVGGGGALAGLLGKAAYDGVKDYFVEREHEERLQKADRLLDAFDDIVKSHEEIKRIDTAIEGILTGHVKVVAAIDALAVKEEHQGKALVSLADTMSAVAKTQTLQGEALKALLGDMRDRRAGEQAAKEIEFAKLKQFYDDNTVGSGEYKEGKQG